MLLPCFFLRLYGYHVLCRLIPGNSVNSALEGNADDEDTSKTVALLMCHSFSRSSWEVRVGTSLVHQQDSLLENDSRSALSRFVARSPDPPGAEPIPFPDQHVSPAIPCYERTYNHLRPPA